MSKIKRKIVVEENFAQFISITKLIYSLKGVSEKYLVEAFETM